MSQTKGIILAGGKGTRLAPSTICCTKTLLPVYDKPMIYYPLSVLMLAGIREILIITNPQDVPLFKKLLGDGSHLGLKIRYKKQEKPNGLPEAFIIGEKFIGDNKVCMILGDNIFYGFTLTGLLERAINSDAGCYTFAYPVKKPEDFGVVEFSKREIDNEGLREVKKIAEKPKRPKSNYAITGIYFVDNKCASIAKKLKPSERGELEITHLINAYLDNKELKVFPLGRGLTWLDVGTNENLLKASNYVETIQSRQGQPIACLEEIAYNKGYIDKDQLIKLVSGTNSDYGTYLKELILSENF